MTAPAWAAALVHQACAEAGVEPPRVLWRRRNDEHSTGVARRSAGTISVRAGHDQLDQQLTLLHELAHWLCPPPARRGRGSRTTEHHGRDFYRAAFGLYERHGIPPTDALRLESARYRSSLRHAAALGVEGAAEALRAHRTTLGERHRREWRVLVPEHPIRLVRDGRWSVCETCRQRVVGSNLARVRRARRPLRHVLLGVAAS